MRVARGARGPALESVERNINEEFVFTSEGREQTPSLSMVDAMMPHHIRHMAAVFVTLG